MDVAAVHHVTHTGGWRVVWVVLAAAAVPAYMAGSRLAPTTLWAIGSAVLMLAVLATGSSKAWLWLRERQQVARNVSLLLKEQYGVSVPGFSGRGVKSVLTVGNLLAGAEVPAVDRVGEQVLLSLVRQGRVYQPVCKTIARMNTWR